MRPYLYFDPYTSPSIIRRHYFDHFQIYVTYPYLKISFVIYIIFVISREVMAEVQFRSKSIRDIHIH